MRKEKVYAMDSTPKRTAMEKKEALRLRLLELPSLLVAFSGGVDSSFLLAMAAIVLKDRVIAATADSITLPKREKEEAILFARKLGVKHILFPSDEALIPEFMKNPPDRCYFCKKALSQRLKSIAAENGIKAVAFAANTDDLTDYRPGHRAAEEMGILSPLIDAGMNKEDIRILSRDMGLPTWEKPSMACLASRIPYGVPITLEKLNTIDAAEEFLFGFGFRQLRVRHHGPVARIEVGGEDFPRFFDDAFRNTVVKKFKELGFMHISLDLEGFVSGSLNRELSL
jgi:pyridinium-3,5-biscarboxylic acid mononucleotide sulfurtransferase